MGEGTDVMGEGTERDPLFDDVDEPPLDFERWVELSAQRLQRDPETRAEILSRAEVSASDWAEADAHWTQAMIDRISAGDAQLAATYGARCADELRRRAGVSLPGAEEDPDFAPLPGATGGEEAAPKGLTASAASTARGAALGASASAASAASVARGAALGSGAGGDAKGAREASGLLGLHDPATADTFPDLRPVDDAAIAAARLVPPPVLGKAPVTAGEGAARQVFVPSYLKEGGPAGGASQGATSASAAAGAPSGGSAGLSSAGASSAGASSGGPEGEKKPGIMALPPGITPVPPALVGAKGGPGGAGVGPHPGAVTADALPIPRGKPLPFTERPAGIAPSAAAAAEASRGTTPATSSPAPHAVNRALGETTALPEGMIKTGAPLPFAGAQAGSASGAPAEAPPLPQELPSLSLEEYAALCAEWSLGGANGEQALGRYKVASVAIWRAVDRRWQEQLARDPALMQRWRHLTGRYRELLQKRPG
ncbi:hypothetical protein [Chondromyces crocatus]|uniref:Uncharacterized protein n=1 Tax=Chondromyces crocatus TaxID=52 RepID=A0A0K1EFR5_CHOCO|nr:hypothetical protein [Chondromyces crocatus]AKT39710.1 uncharacterized protein CMC5_038590 [Chondromyces crocatus]